MKSLARVLLVASLCLVVSVETVPSSDSENDPVSVATAEATAEEAAIVEDEEESIAAEDELCQTEGLPTSSAGTNTPVEEPSGSASMQFVITQKMRAQLSELGYSEADVNGLHPERAAAIISRGIRKPRQGVPKGWNSRSRISRSKVGVLSKLPGVKSTGAVLLAAGVGFLATKRSESSVILPPAVFEEVIEAPPEPSGMLKGNPDDTWLDRLIDTVIFKLKSMISK